MWYSITMTYLSEIRVLVLSKGKGGQPRPHAHVSLDILYFKLSVVELNKI